MNRRDFIKGSVGSATLFVLPDIPVLLLQPPIKIDYLSNWANMVGIDKISCESDRLFRDRILKKIKGD